MGHAKGDLAGDHGEPRSSRPRRRDAGEARRRLAHPLRCRSARYHPRLMSKLAAVAALNAAAAPACARNCRLTRRLMATITS